MESYRHLDLKHDLYWDLIQDDKYAEIEKVIGHTRTDLITEIEDHLIAVEIQYSPISIKAILHRMREHTTKGASTLWLFPEEILTLGSTVRNLKWVKFIQHIQLGVIFLLKNHQIIPARIDNSVVYQLDTFITGKEKILDQQQPINFEDLSFKKNEDYGINITTVEEWWLDTYID